MKCQVKTICIVLLVSYNSLNAQNRLHISYPPVDPANLKPLKIGEKVPDLLFTNMINYSSRIARLSDFVGKLIILDFWSTSCGVCIAQFPKIHGLQAQFGDRVQIITVGFDGNQEGSISAFINKRRGTKYDVKLPTAIQNERDTALQKLFPFTGMPHEIWISPTGYLIGITDQRSLTDYNIRTALDGGDLKDKSKLKMKYIRGNDKFLINNSEFTIRADFYGSIISGYTPGIISGWSFGLQHDSAIYRFFDVNQTVFDYYTRAYRKQYPWVNKKRIFVEPKGKQFYADWPKNANDTAYAMFAQNNLFSYELILPRTKFSMIEAYNYLIKDLDLKFNIKSEISERIVKHLALIRRDNQQVPKSSSTGSSSVISENSQIEKEVCIKGGTIANLITHLSPVMHPDLFILDETGINYLIDIEINFKESSLDYIRRQLWKYNLDLTEREKGVPMLVLEKL